MLQWDGMMTRCDVMPQTFRKAWTVKVKKSGQWEFSHSPVKLVEITEITTHKMWKIWIYSNQIYGNLWNLLYDNALAYTSLTVKKF